MTVFQSKSESIFWKKADDTTLLNRHGKIKEKGGYREAKRIY